MLTTGVECGMEEFGATFFTFCHIEVVCGPWPGTDGGWCLTLMKSAIHLAQLSTNTELIRKMISPLELVLLRNQIQHLIVIIIHSVAKRQNITMEIYCGSMAVLVLLDMEKITSKESTVPDQIHAVWLILKQTFICKMPLWSGFQIS
jgi:hypothetical protein